MNREILFRGKSPITRNWVTGDLFQHGEQRFIMHDNRNTEVITETVGEYTGLTDMNGKKIFEGDIVEVLNPEPFINTTGIVVYNDGCFDVEFCRHDVVRDYLKCLVCNWSCRVVGNINDNPELLEV